MIIVDLSFTPTAADYLAVQRLIFVAGLKRRRFWMAIAGMSVAIIVAMALIVICLDGSTRDATEMILGGIGGGLVGLAALIGISWLLMPRRSRRWFAQQRTLHHEQHQRWTTDGLTQRNARGETYFPWDEFHGWRIGRDVVIVWANEKLVYFAPRRAISDDDLATIRQLLTQSGLRHW